MTRTRELVLFDLDHTLLDGDSDVEWLNFLIEQGAVDRAAEEAANAAMARRYREGTVETLEFVRFYLRTLTSHPMERLLEWRSAYLERSIRPRISTAARQLVAEHQGNGALVRDHHGDQSLPDGADRARVWRRAPDRDRARDARRPLYR